MFELDPEVRKWRTRLERRSSLSARELDELEDHLRARFTLELDLNPALTPARAFTTAVSALGEPRRFEGVREGRVARWRRFLLAGWGLYAVSFFLPVTALPAEVRAEAQALGIRAEYGYEMFWVAFAFPNLIAVLANLAMIGTLSAL